MAAAAVCPSPHAPDLMASRRLPLSNLPNGANSPLRGTATSKRTRPPHGLDDNGPEQAPPSKRHASGVATSIPRTPRKQDTAISNRRVEDGGGDRRPQLMRPRERARPVEHPERLEIDAQSQENIRQWQRHYRKAFPGFVFYFENVTREAKLDCVRHLTELGAREALFFSRDVTHVITTRPIPPKLGRTTSSDESASNTHSTSQFGNSELHNGSVPYHDKDEGPAKASVRAKFDFEASLARKPAMGATSQAAGVRKPNTAQMDILQRAQAMAIRIWQLEKLQRIIMTMQNGADDGPGHNTRSQAVNAAQNKHSKELTLEDVLREDAKKRGHEQDIPQGQEDLVPLKGCYIYVREMNEKTKPIMMREYRKVDRKEDGEWPQFRSVRKHKCPFIEDEPYYESPEPERQQKELDVKSKQKRRAQKQDNCHQKITREIAIPSLEQGDRKCSLADSPYGGNAKAPRRAQQQLPPQPAFHSHLSEGENGDHFKPPAAPHCIRGEPMASGLQASNVTSAIRSQVMSSTAAAPGAKAGTSREIHGLQRKVLERNSGPLLSGMGPSTTSSRITTGPAAPAPPPPPERPMRSNPRAAKQKAQERMRGKGPLTQIYEDPDSEVDTKPKATRLQQAKEERAVKREPKPGYCENCREKFEDFEQHAVSRKHRKFATDKENWKDLDELLQQLVRPGRCESDDDS